MGPASFAGPGPHGAVISTNIRLIPTPTEWITLKDPRTYKAQSWAGPLRLEFTCDFVGEEDQGKVAATMFGPGPDH